MDSRFSYQPFRPTEAERKAVLEEIAILLEHKRRVLGSIHRVQARIPILQQEGTELDNEQKRKLAHISPIRWVPFEVLGCIFEQCFEDPNFSTDSSGSSNTIILHTLSHTTLLRLQLVSKAWYCVVKNSPQLWKRLDLVGPFHLDNIPVHKNKIDSHALHSGRLPLQVTFWNGVDSKAPGPVGSRISSNWTIKSEYDRVDAMNRLLGYLILRTSDRWTAFDLRCIQSCWYKRLELQSVYAYIFSRATALHSLILHENSTPCAFPPLPVPSTSDELPIQDNFLPLLCSHYGNFKTAALETVDLMDIRLVLQPNMSPLRSVRELSIGFADHSQWGSLMEDTLAKSWLSLFPRVKRLVLNAGSNVNLNTSTSTCLFRGQWERWTSVLGLIRTEEYEAKQLEEIYLQGQVPLWVLHNVALPALRTIKIQSSQLGSHNLKNPEWDVIGPSLGAVRNLYLSCSCSNPRPCSCTCSCSCPPPRCLPFWNRQTWTPYEYQAKIREAFAPFLNLETVYAPSCIWQGLDEIFGYGVGGAVEGETVGEKEHRSELITLSGEYVRDLLKERVEEEENNEENLKWDPYPPYVSYYEYQQYKRGW